MGRIKKVLEHKHYPSVMYALLLLVSLLLVISFASIFESAQERSFDLPITGQVVSDSPILELPDFSEYRGIFIMFLIQITIVSVIIFIGYLTIRPLKDKFIDHEYKHFSWKAKRRLKKNKNRTKFSLMHH